MHFVHSSGHPERPREDGLRPTVQTFTLTLSRCIWNRSHAVAPAGIEFTHCGLRLQAPTSYRQVWLPRGRNNNHTWG